MVQDCLCRASGPAGAMLQVEPIFHNFKVKAREIVDGELVEGMGHALESQGIIARCGVCSKTMHYMEHVTVKLRQILHRHDILSGVKVAQVAQEKPVRGVDSDIRKNDTRPGSARTSLCYETLGQKTYRPVFRSLRRLVTAVSSMGLPKSTSAGARARKEANKRDLLANLFLLATRPRTACVVRASHPETQHVSSKTRILSQWQSQW